MGQKTPVETLPARRWVPTLRKASWRDEPPSNRCLSVQRFCSAAIASKSTGSAPAEAVNVSADSRGGVGKARQKIGNNVFQTWQIQHLHIDLRNESQMALLAG